MKKRRTSAGSSLSDSIAFKKIFPKLLEIILSACFWLVVWWIISIRINNTFLLPSPGDVIKALGDIIVTEKFWKITSASLLRIMFGILIATLGGIVLAIITVKIRPVQTLVTPLMSAVKATPVASFIILALVWMSRNTLPVFITVLIVIPIVWTNVSAGLRSVDAGLLDVAQIYGFSRLKKLRMIYVPSVMPFFAAAFRTSLGMAWKAGIAAEVLSTPAEAIGTELYYSKTYLEMPALFAWTLVVIILSLIIEKLFVWALTRFGRSLNMQ